MNIFLKLLVFTAIICVGININAQTDVFVRSYEIPVPAIENTGFGEFIAGVDFDGDGKSEIYAVNNMLDQGGAELIPRMYKFEFNGTTWDSVWSTEMLNIPQQNSWAALAYGDWDKDGKMEMIWGPANNLGGANVNPPRIIVFEYPGDGSDAMGVFVLGSYTPNATWTITDQDNFEVRPFRWLLTDIDSDGDEELLFCDRSGNYRFGVVSVTDIPDNGDQSEVWTMEYSGLGQTLDASVIYDIAVIDNSFYLMHDNGTVTPVSYSNNNWVIEPVYTELIPGGSWKSSSVVDINNDGKKEFVVGGWTSGNNKVYLIQYEDFAGLTATEIADASPLIGSSGRFNGGHFGDVDNDGKIDLLFGTRGTTPLAAIVRVEYQGGDISLASNYIASVVDSLHPSAGAGSRFDIVRAANIDDDPEMEILYTDGNQSGLVPIVILDLQKSVSVEKEKIPSHFFLDQNYPNPFNPLTNIRFGIASESIIDLRVYNMLGEEIAVLIYNQLKSGGVYTATFDASALSSGTYIYVLKTGNFTLSKKLLLLK